MNKQYFYRITKSALGWREIKLQYAVVSKVGNRLKFFPNLRLATYLWWTFSHWFFEAPIYYFYHIIFISLYKGNSSQEKKIARINVAEQLEKYKYINRKIDIIYILVHIGKECKVYLENKKQSQK